MAEQRKLSNKERMEMFQSGVSALTTENEVSNVRQLLRQRYLKNKTEEDETRRQKAEEEAAAKKAREESEEADKKLKQQQQQPDTSKLGRQLARVFRFGGSSGSSSSSNNTRNRHNNNHRGGGGGGRRLAEIDPFDDPRVLAENFAFDDDVADGDDDFLPPRPPPALPVRAPLRGGRRLGQGGDEEEEEEVDIPEFPFVADVAEEDEDDDDSFLSLYRHFLKHKTTVHIAWIGFKLLLYIVCQVIAYKYGFGSVCFALALLLFICTNLRNRRAGELSAYSVFNPWCQPIPSTVGSGQPEDNIVLLGQL